MHSTAFKCVREWDVLASASDAPKDSEGLRLGSDLGCPKWMESNGGGHVFVVSALFRHENAFACVPNHLSAEEVAEEEGQGGENRVEDPKTRSYRLILNRHRCLVELGLMASKAEMDQGRRPRPTLAHLTKQRPKVLVPGSTEDTSQRKVIEDLSREENREAVEACKVIEVDDAPEEEVPLSRKRKARASGTETSHAKENAVEVVDNYTSTQAPGGRDGRPYNSKRRFREFIGAPGARIPDDALRNLPFYPSMGAQAIKKYFTPKWEEFSSHGELEDVLEASLASAIKASAMQMMVLGEFRTQGHCRRSGGCKQGERRLLKEAKSCDEEIQSLRKDLESSENGRKEAEVGRKEVEAKLANADAEFVANFHNTEAYTNFSDYFARIGQHEVLTALRNDHSNFDIEPLEARFPPPDVEGEEEN
ncbi:hypothetical protein Adt_34970 [Abeliophyllum distichum]|uniref:Uncharacterized protein n=1 Tax=Abeliophyllum distichum TaxID=126358 RepID=A0ABD1QGU2_9LAMI